MGLVNDHRMIMARVALMTSVTMTVIGPGRTMMVGAEPGPGDSLAHIRLSVGGLPGEGAASQLKSH